MTRSFGPYLVLFLIENRISKWIFQHLIPLDLKINSRNFKDYLETLMIANLAPHETQLPLAFAFSFHCCPSGRNGRFGSRGCLLNFCRRYGKWVLTPQQGAVRLERFWGEYEAKNPARHRLIFLLKGTLHSFFKIEFDSSENLNQFWKQTH